MKRAQVDWRSIVEEHKIFAMIRTDQEDKALQAARAAIAGGVRIIEITLNTPGALRVLKALSGEKNVFLGAGTVLSVKQAKAALKAGAKFIVSPHYDPRIVTFVKRRGLLCVAGAATPSEAVAAWQRGAGLIKLFPIEQLGGPAFVRQLLAPLPDLPLLACGGITAKNSGEYIAAGVRALGLGGALFKDLLVGKNYQGVTKAAAHLIEVVQSESYSPQPAKLEVQEKGQKKK